MSLLFILSIARSLAPSILLSSLRCLCQYVVLDLFSMSFLVISCFCPLFGSMNPEIYQLNLTFKVHRKWNLCIFILKMCFLFWTITVTKTKASAVSAREIMTIECGSNHIIDSTLHQSICIRNWAAVECAKWCFGFKMHSDIHYLRFSARFIPSLILCLSVLYTSTSSHSVSVCLCVLWLLLLLLFSEKFAMQWIFVLIADHELGGPQQIARERAKDASWERTQNIAIRFYYIIWNILDIFCFYFMYFWYAHCTFCE